MDHLTEPLRRSLLGQGRSCTTLGSPFSGAMLALLVERLEPLVAPLLAPWAEALLPAVVADAVPLRLLGALHWLVLTGAEPALAALYPPHASGFDAEAFASVLPDVLERRRAESERFLQGPPQTNEVRRSLALIGGFLSVAKETGLPLRCLEIGASAGLNQNWDRYAYRFSEGARWGPEDAAVELDGDWRGPPPPLDGPLSVAERAACDVHAIDLRDPDQALRMQAYIWPDQRDRMARLRAAIALALELGTRVEQADADAWLAERLTPRPGAVTVLYHSVMWQYMPQATQQAILARLQARGAEASEAAPLAWLRMEPAHVQTADMEVRLTTWPGGTERLLARAHPHGAWVAWGAA